MTLLPFGKDVPLSPGEFQNEINRLIERLVHSGISTRPLDGQDWAPLMDVLEEEDRFLVTAEVPGLDSADIDVSFSGDALTIRGHKPNERREGDENHYLRKERPFGSFMRTIQLSQSVDPERIAASCRKGVLEISLGKKEKDRPRSIRVEIAE